MAGHDPNIQGLKREWLAARIFAVVGGLLLMVVLVLAIVGGPNTLSPEQDRALQQRQLAVALCSAGLTSAQGFALVPAYTKLASAVIQTGSVNGRYTCFAETDAAKYQITFDLMCKDLNDPKCISLYSVTQDGTGAIYQRH